MITNPVHAALFRLIPQAQAALLSVLPAEAVAARLCPNCSTSTMRFCFYMIRDSEEGSTLSKADNADSTSDESDVRFASNRVIRLPARVSREAGSS